MINIKHRDMNIGKWIVVSFVLFAAFIATLVTVCIRQDVSLVSKNYYEEELHFQQQIERAKNTSALETKPVVTLDGTMLTIAFNQSQPVTEGTLDLFCPSNAKMDRTYKLAPELNAQSFDLDGLNRGMYRVRLKWTMGSSQFYQEEVVNL